MFLTEDKVTAHICLKDLLRLHWFTSDMFIPNPVVFPYRFLAIAPGLHHWTCSNHPKRKAVSKATLGVF